GAQVSDRPDQFTQRRPHRYAACPMGSQGSRSQALGLRGFIVCVRRQPGASQAGGDALSSHLALWTHEVCGRRVLSSLYATIRIGDSILEILKRVLSTAAP